MGRNFSLRFACSTPKTNAFLARQKNRVGEIPQRRKSQDQRRAAYGGDAEEASLKQAPSATI
jgi:hypothetical protein